MRRLTNTALVAGVVLLASLVAVAYVAAVALATYRTLTTPEEA